MRPKLHNRPVGTIISQPILRVLFVPRLVNCAEFCASSFRFSFAKTHRIYLEILKVTSCDRTCQAPAGAQ